MDPKKTALVLIEYQNDFTSEGGTLHQAVKPVMDSTNMLANTVETVEKARALGATIIFAPITFTDDYHELSPQPYGILKGVVDSKSFRKGTWGAEMVDVLKPQRRGHCRRRQARALRLRQHQSRFRAPKPRHHRHRARRLPAPIAASS